MQSCPPSPGAASGAWRLSSCWSVSSDPAATSAACPPSSPRWRQPFLCNPPHPPAAPPARPGSLCCGRAAWWPEGPSGREGAVRPQPAWSREPGGSLPSALGALGKPPGWWGLLDPPRLLGSVCEPLRASCDPVLAAVGAGGTSVPAGVSSLAPLPPSLPSPHPPPHLVEMRL